MSQTKEMKTDRLQQNIVLMKITCLGMACFPLKKRPYRILAISENTSLYDFAESITKSFCFYFDHCFGFYDKPEREHESFEAYELFVDLEEAGELKNLCCEFMNCVPRGVEKTKIKDAFEKQGKKMFFRFDYGDDWEFEIERLNTVESKLRKKYPYIIESRGLSPKQYPAWK